MPSDQEIRILIDDVAHARVVQYGELPTWLQEGVESAIRSALTVADWAHRAREFVVQVWREGELLDQAHHEDQPTARRAWLGEVHSRPDTDFVVLVRVVADDTELLAGRRGREARCA